MFRNTLPFRHWLTATIIIPREEAEERARTSPQEGAEGPLPVPKNCITIP